MLKKINFASTFVLVMVAAILVTPLTSYASFTQKAIVRGDGVRLRKTPGYDGIILELMYKGEDITLSADVLPPPDLAIWVYARREKTGTEGWMHWNYYDHE